MGITVISDNEDLLIPIDDDLKLHCRIDGTSEDSLIEWYLRAATRYCEIMRAESFLDRQYRFTTLAPIAIDDRTRCIRELANDVVSLAQLPIGPVKSIESVKYYDSNGTLQTLSASYYRLVAGENLVVFTDSLDLADREDAVRIEYTAGYGTNDEYGFNDVPWHYKQAIRLLAAESYIKREAGVTSISSAVDRLLRLG